MFDNSSGGMDDLLKGLVEILHRSMDETTLEQAVFYSKFDEASNRVRMDAVSKVKGDMTTGALVPNPDNWAPSLFLEMSLEDVERLRDRLDEYLLFARAKS